MRSKDARPLPSGPVLGRYLFKIRPRGPGGARRYYLGVARAIISEALGRPTRPAASYLPGPDPLLIRTDGLLFSVRPGTYDLTTLALTPEPVEVLRFFRPKPTDVVLDIGANVGTYAVRLGRCARLVIAVEPEPSNFQQLLQHVRENQLGNVLPVMAAISDHTGTAKLHLTEGSAQHSLEPETDDPNAVRSNRSIEVRALTLDALVEDHKLDRIDWLKVDVEGAELQVLRGGERALGITRHLILEYGHQNLPEILSLLERRGLTLVWRGRTYLTAVRPEVGARPLTRGS